jgi:outer membrane protein OmpA-like peptidoglycan-associated protein
MPATRVLAALAATAVVLTGLLALVATVVVRDDVETELAERARQALSQAELPTDVVSFSGRDASIRARSPREAVLASAVVAEVDGVRSVDIAAFTSGPRTGSDSDALASPDAAAKARLQRSLDRVLAEHPITFRPDSATPTRAGRQAVAEVASVLSDAPSDWRFEVQGHVARVSDTDRKGAMELSRARAETVADELVDAGLPRRRLTTVGHGDTRPLSTLGTSAIDRRVEIHVR